MKAGLVLSDADFAERGLPASDTIITMPTPSMLRVPLSSLTGTQRFIARVSDGDRVYAGQEIAWPQDAEGASITAPVDAEVIAIPGDENINSGTAYIELNTAVSLTAPLREEQQQLDPAQIIRKAGITGLGGATFPAHRKWHTNGIETMIVNAVECEPLISCDRALMLTYTNELVTALQTLRQQTGAARVLLAIAANNTDLIELFNEKLATVADACISIGTVKHRFPSGSERQLIAMLCGVELADNQRPTDRGFVCFNIATALAIHRALTARQHLASRVVTVTGNAIDKPVNVSVTFGTPIIELLRFVQPQFPDSLQVTLGGPVSGKPLADLTRPVMADCNCLLVEHKTTKVNKVTACIRCGECEKVCPQDLLPQQLHWSLKSNDLISASQQRLAMCIECGCCDLVCPSRIPLTAQFRQARSTLKEQQQLGTRAQKSEQRYNARAQRLAQREAEKQQRLAQRKLEIEQRKRQNPKAAIQAALERAKAKRGRHD